MFNLRSTLSVFGRNVTKTELFSNALRSHRRAIVAALLAAFAGLLLANETKAQNESAQMVLVGDSVEPRQFNLFDSDEEISELSSVYVMVLRGKTIVPDFVVKVKLRNSEGDFANIWDIHTNYKGVAGFLPNTETRSKEAQIVFRNDKGKEITSILRMKSSRDNFFIIQLDEDKVEASRLVKKNKSVLPINPTTEQTTKAACSTEKSSYRSGSALKVCDLSTKACPNPSKGSFVLFLETKQEEPLEIQLIDDKGSLVLTKLAQAIVGQNEIPLSLPNAVKGVYLLRVKQLSEEATMRVVVE